MYMNICDVMQLREYVATTILDAESQTIWQQWERLALWFDDDEDALQIPLHHPN